jgi:thiol-disulfide isomerase/thioredoxin
MFRAAAIALLALSAGLLPAQQPLDARALLRSVADQIAAASTLRADIEAETVVAVPGQPPVRSQTTVRVAASGNRAILQVDRAGQPAWLIVADGTTLSVLDRAADSYTQVPFDGDPERLTSKPTSAIPLAMQAGVPLLLGRAAALRQLAEDNTVTLTTAPQPLGAVLVTAERANGQQTGFVVTPGDPPRLEAILLAGADGKLDPNLPLHRSRFTRLTLGEPIPDSHFRFAPPAGAKRIEVAGAAPTVPAAVPPATRELGRAPRQPADLIGYRAPDFSLPISGIGSTINLADHRGRDIVVLDFWASWCGPCRRGLPVVSQVAGRYAAQGVVFYAVNLREDDRTIANFLRSNGLSVTVLRDANGAVARSFGVTGIPATIVIGRDGAVAAAHVGFGPGTGDQLARDLAKAIGGTQ